ncbi:MAG: hypothetical protein NZM25_07780 [Leptospiraceae bacterium]|nr:hypothetical protein [Leptospiraceae bacterium]MDW8305499.1 hypothetical protein [Leptospiraceae bacterium]
MKKGYKSWTLFLLKLFILPSLSAIQKFQWGGRTPFDAHRLHQVEIITGQKKRQVLQLKPLGYQSQPQYPLADEIYLSFEEAPESYSRKELFVHALFEREKLPGAVGYAAVFRFGHHKLSMKLPPSFFLYDKTSVGGFSLFFLVKPNTLRTKVPLVEKVSYLGGQKYGLGVYAEKELVKAYLWNLFHSSQGISYSFELKGKDPLSIYEFNAILLLYNEATKSLALYLNGKEQDIVYTTQSLAMSGSPLYMKNHEAERSELVLAQGFSGAIDELIFTKNLLSPDFSPQLYAGTIKSPHFPQEKGGEFLSKVYDIGFSASEIRELRYQATRPAGTQLYLYLRTSDAPFDPQLSEEILPFVKVSDKTTYRGRYFQYRVDFYPDAMGRLSPTLEAVEVVANPNPPPERPRGLMAEDVGENFVVLSFWRNQEIDVMHGGRYHIYYGLRPYEPLGVIRYAYVEVSDYGVHTKTINDRDHRSEKSPNRIVFRINNDIIMQNLLYARRRPHLSHDYPLLQRNTPYFFWVTACDNAFQEESLYLDHESPPSEPLLVRLP